MKMLLIVDPQIDFIEGSLPVEGAIDAMERLASYVNESGGEYACKVITADWHPFRHSSFSAEGGIWPRHCVADTVGAAIYPPLVEPLYLTAGDTVVLHKGTDAATEEYSIFANREAAGEINRLVGEHDIDRIDICGLAGDICVLNTLKDATAIYGNKMFKVLTRFSPSLDGGKTLNEFIDLNKIECDR